MPFKVIVLISSLLLAFAGKGTAQSSNFQPFLGDTLTRWEGLLSYFEPINFNAYNPPNPMKGWAVFGHFEVEARPWGVVDSVMLHAVRFRHPGKSEWESDGFFLYEDTNHYFLVQTQINHSGYSGGGKVFIDNGLMDSTEIADALEDIENSWFDYSSNTPRIFLGYIGAKPSIDGAPELQGYSFGPHLVLGNNFTPPGGGGSLIGATIDSVVYLNNIRVAYTSKVKGDFEIFSYPAFYPMLLNPGPDPNEVFQFIEGAGNNFVLTGKIMETAYSPDIQSEVARLHLSSLSCYWRDGNLISTHGLYPVYGCGSPLDSAWQFTGMQQAQEATGALLYPNPSQGMVRIEAKELHAEASFFFVSMSGKVVYSIQDIDPQHLNTQSLSSGLYEVFFKNPDGQTYRVGRLVVP